VSRITNGGGGWLRSDDFCCYAATKLYNGRTHFTLLIPVLDIVTS
jgi:hypothetical protein